MIEKDKVWVFLPAFNEATVIGSVIRRIKDCGHSNVVVIDDGSVDNTSECAKNEGAFLLRMCINRGVGAAFQTALLYARRKSIQHLILIDADGQHYPEDIERLLELAHQQKADLVIGSRFLENRDSVPWSRRIFNKIANFLTILGRSRVTDSQSGFRYLNNKAIEKIELDLDNYAVCTEMIWKSKKMKLRLKEAPIRVIYTEYSMSKGQNLWKGFQTGISLITKIFH